MPTFTFTSPEGKKYTVNGPDGATQEQAFQILQTQIGAQQQAPANSKPFGEQLNDFISDTPRQVGLTARYGLEGLGGLADVIASPFRVGLNAVLPKKQSLSGLVKGDAPRPAIEGNSGSALADLIGLPNPQTSAERVIGDASRMVAGGALPIGAGAALASRGSGVAQGVGRMLAANPGMQTLSAGAAGAAGGYTRETGGNEGSQLAASLAAGLAAPAIAGAVTRGAQSIRNAVTARQAPPQVQIDITINNALQDSGLKLSDLPQSVAAGIRRDVADAYKIGDTISPDAVRRLADYRLTGLTPTKARLTLDPAEVTRQANLAKAGANSSDPAAQALARTQNANNQQLITGLNGLGASAIDDAYAGGNKVIAALRGRDERARELIGSYYNQARASDGRSAMLDPVAFVNRANDALDQSLLGGAIPNDVRGLLNGVAEGRIPFTVDVAEQFKTRLGEAAREAAARGEMSQAKAVGMIRSALDDAPLLPGQEIGQEAIDAFKLGRRMNATYMEAVNRTPALQAVRDGIEPDKFIQQFIIGKGNNANVMDVAQLKSSIKNNPDALAAVKEQITAYLKQQALGGASDEVGTFSQSAYNKALNAIGDRKLRLFFSPEELAQMKAIGRVASYEQVQPAGAAVNNSNTAGAMGGLLERMGQSPMLGRIPFGRAAIGEPLQNILISQQANLAMNAPQALVAPGIAQSGARYRQPLMLSPAALTGMEDPETRRLRESGLLLP